MATSDMEDAGPSIAGGANERPIAASQLKAFVERIERMEDEKASIALDIREIYAEVKGQGYDTKVLRAIVRMRKQDAGELAEQRALTELYLEALGMA